MSDCVHDWTVSPYAHEAVCAACGAYKAISFAFMALRSHLAAVTAELDALKGCRCEVLGVDEGGGTDTRSCPEHAYESGRRHERSVYLEEKAALVLERDEARRDRNKAEAAANLQLVPREMFPSAAVAWDKLRSERDAALSRAETAERERDEWKGQRDGWQAEWEKLVGTSVQENNESRRALGEALLRAAQAERERDAARAEIAELRAELEAMASRLDDANAEIEISAKERAESDATIATLRAEVDFLRGERDDAAMFPCLSPYDWIDIGTAFALFAARAEVARLTAELAEAKEQASAADSAAFKEMAESIHLSARVAQLETVVDAAKSVDDDWADDEEPNVSANALRLLRERLRALAALTPAADAKEGAT